MGLSRVGDRLEADGGGGGQRAPQALLTSQAPAQDDPLRKAEYLEFEGQHCPFIVELKTISSLLKNFFFKRKNKSRINAVFKK